MFVQSLALVDTFCVQRCLDLWMRQFQPIPRHHIPSLNMLKLKQKAKSVTGSQPFYQQNHFVLGCKPLVSNVFYTTLNKPPQNICLRNHFVGTMPEIWNFILSKGHVFFQENIRFKKHHCFPKASRKSCSNRSRLKTAWSCQISVAGWWILFPLLVEKYQYLASTNKLQVGELYTYIAYYCMQCW